jgi:outer membrane protein
MFKKISLPIIFLIILQSVIIADDKITYINMEVLMNKSIAGQSIVKQLEGMHKKNIKNFKSSEENLKNEEKNILAQKNILSKEEFENKIKLLRNEAKKYRENRRKAIDELNSKRIAATSELLKVINPILKNYSADNSISMIFQKKNIIIGKVELDITNDVLKIINDKIKKINIK